MKVEYQRLERPNENYILEDISKVRIYPESITVYSKDKYGTELGIELVKEEISDKIVIIRE